MGLSDSRRLQYCPVFISGSYGCRKEFILINKMYPPFCVHFYPEKWTDFPFCSDWFSTFEEVLDYAAHHHPGYIYRIGYWSAPMSDLKNCYFFMTEVGCDFQFSLFGGN